MLPIYHLLIPIAVLRLFRADKKIVFFLSTIAILPDLDHISILFKADWTRALFHNIFFGILLIVILLYLKQKLHIKGRSTLAKGLRHISKYDNKKFLLIALFMFISHILLDYNGVAAIWPVSKLFFRFDFNTMSFSFLTAEIINAGLLNIPLKKIVFHLGLVSAGLIVLFLEAYIAHKIKEIREEASKG